MAAASEKSAKVKVVWLVSDTSRKAGDRESVDAETADRLVANNQARRA